MNGLTAYRKTNYYWQELTVANSSAPIFQSVTNKAVLPPGPNGTIMGNVYVPQAPEQFSYDLDGNLTNDGRWAYVWDAENRLIFMTNNANVPNAAKMTLTFIYDYLGRRVGKTVSNFNGSSYQITLSNSFVYDAWNMVDELNATNNGVIRSCLWGADMTGQTSGAPNGAGVVGAMLTISEPTAAQFPSFDGNGNVMALVDTTSSAVTGQYEYGPFGEVIRATGLTARANPFRFSTEYQDDETDLLSYGFRYLDTSTGRWLSRDPIAEKGGLSLYEFADNNPIGYTDRLEPVLNF